MEAYTTADAARLTGSTVRALRKRIERGTLRAVRREDGWRIPRSELERAGLHVGPPAETTDVVRELTETIRRQERELQELRALPRKVEEERRRFEEAQAAAERAVRAIEAAEGQARREAVERQAAERAREELRAQLEEIASAGPIRALRLRRKLRAGSAA